MRRANEEERREEAYLEAIPTRRLRRRYDRAVARLDRAELAMEIASEEYSEARALHQRASGRLANVVRSIDAALDRGPIEPPRREPPVIVDPPPRTQDMSDAPQRVEPIEPRRIDAEVFGNGTFIFQGTTSPGVARDAYAAVELTLAQPRQIVLGIRGNVGRVGLGHAYSKSSNDAFMSLKGWDIDVAFVGFKEHGNPEPSLGPIFLGSKANDAGVFPVCDRALFFGVGIHADKDPYAFRQYGYCREFAFDRCWIVPNAEYVATAGMHRSAFLFHKDWESLTLKRYEPRGNRFEEHIPYIQGGGFTQVLDCNLFGGRRTGFQDRSHQDSDYPSPTRHGDFIADGNYAEGFGWNHSEASGGQWLTVWFSGEYKVRISNNRCTDARYGCLGISKGVPSSDPYLTDDGLSHSNVYIWGNEFENKRASRSCVSLADARMIHFGEGNSFIGPDHGSHAMVLGSQWGWKNAGAQTPKDWAFYGASALPTWPVHEYIPAIDKFLTLNDDSHREHLAVTR